MNGSATFLQTLALLLLASGPVRPAPPPATSDHCGSCHVDIYRTWVKSAHARAVEDPVFLAAYREVSLSEGADIARICLGCHAPLAALNGDWDLKYHITWEGVNCEACHSIASVDASAANPVAHYDLGPVKRGPIVDAVSMEHEVAYSELHTTSAVCAACHEFHNGEGLPIMTTYSEWRESDAAREGRQCQDCHMNRTRAHVVDPRVARVGHAEVNLHEVPGGHSLSQLQKALTVVVRPVRTPEALEVEVQVRNTGAGHAVPTGMPGRRVVLTVEVEPGIGKGISERRIYGKTFADASGNPIHNDSRYFSPGIRMLDDTRIAAGERRTEHFRFPVPPGEAAKVTARLHYEHTPTQAEEYATYLVFHSDVRTIAPVR